MPIISTKCKRLIDTNRFAIYTVIGIIAGVFSGLVLKSILWSGHKEKTDHRLIRYLALPGVICMRLFILIIAPLLVTSLSLSFLPIKTENPFDKLRRFNEKHQRKQLKLSSKQQQQLQQQRSTKQLKQKKIDEKNLDAQKLIMVTFMVFGIFSLLASIFGACLMLTFGSFAYDHNNNNNNNNNNNDGGGGGTVDDGGGNFLIESLPTSTTTTIATTIINKNNGTNVGTIDIGNNINTNSSISMFNDNDDDENIKNLKNSIIHKYYQHDTIYNIFLNLFPENIITPMFMSSYSKTKIIWPSNLSRLMERDYKLHTQNETLINYKVNMLSLCIISLCLGVILQKLGPERTKTFRATLYELDNITHTIMNTLMKLLPIGMFFWMLAESMKVNSMLTILLKLAYFYLIVIGAFLFWLLVFYPVIHVIFTRENPFKLYKNILSAIVIAFGSCSSAITLPETMRCMREKCGLSNRICQTVLPLGMTLHMNGPAMYFPMTAIFVAYINQIPVGFYSVIVLCLFAVIMSMGVPPVVGTGTTMLNHMAVASVLGVDNPQDVLAYILAFEWMMERIRTSTNIIGDCFAAKFIERILNIQDDDWHDDDNCVSCVESEEKL